jgi:hypothetical protein
LWLGVFTSISTFAQVPTITSFLPASGPIDTTVAISGLNFNTTASNDVVYFGAAKGTVTAASNVLLDVIVPVGANFQPITVTDITSGLTAYSEQPFIVTFTSTQPIDANSFLAAAQPATPNNPAHVAIADLDGDGRPDIVITDTVGTISVFRNTSANNVTSFAPRVDLSAGDYTNLITTGDFDGDGRTDIAVTNTVTNTVSVFQNTSTIGAITFAARIDLATDGSPVGIAVGDLDGDGKPDIVVANAYSDTISVFRNTSTKGVMSFATKIDFAAGRTPCIIAMGDLDGDGRPDLAVSNADTNVVSVFRNTSAIGSISFASMVDFGAGGPSLQVAIADMNGDGKPDLIAGNHNDTLRVLQNASTIGNVSFTPAVDVQMDNNTYPFLIGTGDLNGDGRPDVVVTNHNGNDLIVFSNTSAGGAISLAPRVDLAVGGATWGVAIGDLDGDGIPDIVAPIYSNNTVLILRNTIPVSPNGMERIQTEIPTVFSLAQNYPNPFNPTTVINYQLPENAHVTLRVFDVVGREVETLINENQSAGYKSVTFDATSLPSGTYLYRLEAGAFHDTKKLLLLR